MPIQSISAAKLALRPSGNALPKTEEAGGKSFGQFLTESLDKVNDLQHKASQDATDLASGRIEDISQVVISAEKAAVALQLTIQVRNKMLESYQEMMRMQV